MLRLFLHAEHLILDMKLLLLMLVSNLLHLELSLKLGYFALERAVLFLQGEDLSLLPFNFAAEVRRHLSWHVKLLKLLFSSSDHHLRLLVLKILLLILYLI